MIRCRDGFLRGMCEDPMCSHYRGGGAGKKPRTVRSCAGGCGRVATRNYCAQCRAAGVPAQRKKVRDLQRTGGDARG